MSDNSTVGGSGLWFERDDGGRAAAGFQGTTGDCVTRAIAIATGKPYRQVYDLVNGYGKTERVTPKMKARRTGDGRSSARTGVFKPTTKRILADLGWERVATMAIGQGCTTHLRAWEIPMVGTILVQLSKHLTVVRDGVILDTHDPSREGTRCVYGYWTPPTS